MKKFDPAPLELHVPHDRRAQRSDGVRKGRTGEADSQRLRHRRASKRRASLEHDGSQSRPRQIKRRRQPVVPGADDDRRSGQQLSAFSSQLPVASCQLPVASCQLPVASSQFPVSSSQFPVFSLQFSVPSFRFTVPGSSSRFRFQFTAPSYQFSVSRIPNPWSSIPESRIPNPDVVTP